jgi:pilus assembly protein CpaB
MRARSLFIVLALLCAVVVVIVIVMNLQAPPTSAAIPVHPPTVIAANGPIPVGTLIKPQDLAFVTAPADVLPGTTFDRVWAAKPEEQPAADAKTDAEVIGAVTRHRIEAGAVIYRDAVVKPGDSGFLAAVLKPNMRAVTVGVNVVSGAGGLIYPGDHVDLLLTQTFKDPEVSIKQNTVTETIAQNLRVLAIDQTVQASPPPNGEGRVARTVTLEVSPTYAQKITDAVRLGELSLTIRSLEAVVQADGSTTESATQSDASNGSVLKPEDSGSVSPTVVEIANQIDKSKQKPPVIVIMKGEKREEQSVH